MKAGKEIIVHVCESGIVVVVDKSLVNAAMQTMPLPIHAFNSVDRAIAFIRKTIKETQLKP